MSRSRLCPSSEHGACYWDVGGDAGRAKATAVRKAKADAHAQLVGTAIAQLAVRGITSANGLARALNEQGVKTPRGGKWAARSVIDIRKRLRAAT
jgi:hypothetical protein